MNNLHLIHVVPNQIEPPVTHKGVVSKNISRSCRRYWNIFAEVQYCRILYQGFLSFYRFFFQESDFAKSKLSLAWRKTHLTGKKWLKQQNLDSVFR